MDKAFVDGLLIECLVPMFMLGGVALAALGIVEAGGRIRAKVRGEKWESPFVW